MTDVIKQISKKQVRLGLLRDNSFINFCKIGFTGDNTLIFASNFHVKDGALEIGTTRVYKNKIVEQQPPEMFRIKSGCHISLHPCGQVMHLRENPKGMVLSEKRFNWYPVKEPFHLLNLYSPPLDKCVTSKKTTPFFAPAPEGYKDSILLKVDIFPSNVKEHFPYSTSIWIFWGYCPDYWVRVSFIITNQRNDPMLLWPLDDGLLDRERFV